MLFTPACDHVRLVAADERSNRESAALRHAIAVRLALGANRLRVVRLVLRNGLMLVAAGAAAGLALAWGLSRVAGEWIGTTARMDGATVGAALATLFVAGTIAALIPAFGAASVDPNGALRAE